MTFLLQKAVQYKKKTFAKKNHQIVVFFSYDLPDFLVYNYYVCILFYMYVIASTTEIQHNRMNDYVIKNEI